MYPNEPTLTEHYVQQMEKEGWSREKIIKQYIDHHDTDKMTEGVRYYRKENDINERVLYRYDDNGNKVVDEFAPNNRIPSGFHKLLVDQKVGYLVGKPVSINGKDGTAVDKVKEYVGDEFNDLMPELVKHASNKGQEWVHVYINEDGEFDYIRIPAQEVIPIYDNTKRKDLMAVIRYYYLDDETMKIEYWDDKTVTFYEEISGKVVLDTSDDRPNPMPHFYYQDGDERTGYGWERVPFISFKNNEECLSDLNMYKALIDAYDLTLSDATNTIQAAQNFIYILKGYADTDMRNFYVNLKQNKGLAFDEDGDLDIAQPEPPMNSIDSILDRYADNIFGDGMGVDISPDKFGQNPSGVALKNLYSYLNMKANILERKFTKALHEFAWFMQEYDSVVDSGFDASTINFTFTHSMLSNEVEQIEMFVSQGGQISNQTALANHPWVENPQEEQERIDEDIAREGAGLSDVGGASGGSAESEKGTKQCPECKGTGTITNDSGQQVTCPRCKGDGVITVG